MRIGIALVQQESNTFAPGRCEWESFTVRRGVAAAVHTRGTNSEMAGATEAVTGAGHVAVPLLYAWALPAGPLSRRAFSRLRDLLIEQITGARLDGLVLALHGAMAAETYPDADAELIGAARSAVGSIPLGVSLDLHANVTRRMVDAADVMVGYHTDPHVDMREAGRRAAAQIVGILEGSIEPAIALAKRPMIVPAESMNTTSGPLAAVRETADAVQDVLDISLFPVQPWLDVPELGFGALVTTNGDPHRSADLARHFADDVWRRRDAFRVPRLMPPRDAVLAAVASPVRPFIIAESADAPTAGAAGDSPVMISALLEHGTGLKAVVPVVDPAGVDRCHVAGVTAEVQLTVGAAIDDRWWNPVHLHATVVGIGAGEYRLQGAGYTGTEVSMGRYAVVASGDVVILLSERPAWTADPATFRFAGIDLDRADVLVVRSCSDYRPNFPDSADAAVTLDVPGTATPRLEHLEFTRAPRPLWPLDAFPRDR